MFIDFKYNRNLGCDAVWFGTDLYTLRNTISPIFTVDESVYYHEDGSTTLVTSSRKFISTRLHDVTARRTVISADRFVNKKSLVR
jgi:hypothetical protein